MITHRQGADATLPFGPVGRGIGRFLRFPLFAPAFPLSACQFFSFPVCSMTARLAALLFTTVCVSISTSLFAQQPQSPQQLADAELPSLLTIYKDLHTHPELSGHEEKSSALVAKELKAVGCEVTEKVGKYEKPNLTPFGVVGVMKNGDGPVVLVRTDLDGLPVTEETGLPYASKDTATNA